MFIITLFNAFFTSMYVMQDTAGKRLRMEFWGKIYTAFRNMLYWYLALLAFIGNSVTQINPSCITIVRSSLFYCTIYKTEFSLQVGELSTVNRTQCLCTHLTSFATKLFVMPIPIDLESCLIPKLLEEYERLIEIDDITERKVSVTSSMFLVHKLKLIKYKLMVEQWEIMVKQRLSITHG